MADLTITIPTAHVPRVRAAMVNLLKQGVEGELVEPTAQEILDKAKAVCIYALKRTVRKHEESEAKKTAIGAIAALDIT